MKLGPDLSSSLERQLRLSMFGLLGRFMRANMLLQQVQQGYMRDAMQILDSPFIANWSKLCSGNVAGDSGAHILGSKLTKQHQRIVHVFQLASTTSAVMVANDTKSMPV